MFKVLILICATHATRSIIVRDPLPHGEYKFSYEIEDPATGDSKRLRETRKGGIVTGAYSVLDPDGTRRTVHYTADPTLGFKAVLVQEPVMDIKLPVQHTPTLYTSDQPHTPTLYTSDHGLLNTYAKPYYQFVGKRKKYFTPAAELLPDKSPVNGFYFEPNKSFD